MAHLVLYESRVPAGFEQVSGIGPAKRVQVESVGESQLVTVSAHPADQGRLDDEPAAFTREQVERVRFAAAVGEPVLEDAGGPPPDGEHAAWLVRRGPLGLPVADLAHAKRAELAGVRITGEVDGLEVAQLVEPEPVGIRDFHHDRISVGGLPTLASGLAAALNLVVGMVEQGVDLIAGVGALRRSAVVVLDVGSGVPVEEDLSWVRAKVPLAD